MIQNLGPKLEAIVRVGSCDLESVRRCQPQIVHFTCRFFFLFTISLNSDNSEQGALLSHSSNPQYL